jgi:hypothetical protein
MSMAPLASGGSQRFYFTAVTAIASHLIPSAWNLAGAGSALTSDGSSLCSDKNVSKNKSSAVARGFAACRSLSDTPSRREPPIARSARISPRAPGVRLILDALHSI